MVIAPHRLNANDPDMSSVLRLIQMEFAYMNARIDPPSSMNHLTVAELTSSPGEVWAIGSPPIACILLTPKPGKLYLSKLAVSTAARGSRHARQLINQAETRARELGLSILELATRIELTENHQVFQAMRFTEHERTAHPGHTRPTSVTFRRSVQPPNDQEDIPPSETVPAMIA